MRNLPNTPKFKYGDKVKITHEFYGKVDGLIINYERDFETSFEIKFSYEVLILSGKSKGRTFSIGENEI
jgi:hypothetical protein